MATCIYAIAGWSCVGYAVYTGDWRYAVAATLIFLHGEIQALKSDIRKK